MSADGNVVFGDDLDAPARIDIAPNATAHRSRRAARRRPTSPPAPGAAAAGWSHMAQRISTPHPGTWRDTWRDT